MLKLISKTLHRFTIPVMLFSVTALFYFGCKKFDFSPNKPEKTNEAITAEFFTLPPNTNPAVQKVAAALKSINDKTPFIPDIAKVYGNIVWGINAFYLQMPGNKPMQINLQMPQYKSALLPVQQL